MLFVSLVYLLAILKFSPFANRRMNFIEALCNVNLFLMYFCALLFIAEVDGEDHGRGEHPGVQIEGGEFGVNGRCGGNGAKSGRGSGFVAGREAGDMTNSKTLFSACRSPAVSCFVTQTQEEEEEGWVDG